MNTDEQVLESAASQWYRENKKKIKSTICNLQDYPEEVKPITIFMAGTPGAGKTELSKSLIEIFDRPMVRIDADEIREMMRDIGYNGKNSHVFQRIVGNAVNNLYGAVLSNKQSVVVDGTFAYGNWRVNIERSLKSNRAVEIYYLYQDPLIAWDFVKVREDKQGRRVPKEVFINDYFTALENVEKAKQIFGRNLTVYFAKNNYKKNLEELRVDVQNIANHIPNLYTREDLNKCLQ